MTDDHHDNRYEDGEPLPTIDWDFVPYEEARVAIPAGSGIGAHAPNGNKERGRRKPTRADP